MSTETVPSSVTPPPFVDLTLRTAERDAIVRALTATNGNRNQAAKLLGIARSTLFIKLKEYEIRGTYRFEVGE